MKTKNVIILKWVVVDWVGLKKKFKKKQIQLLHDSKQCEITSLFSTSIWKILINWEKQESVWISLCYNRTIYGQDIKRQNKKLFHWFISTQLTSSSLHQTKMTFQLFVLESCLKHTTTVSLKIIYWWTLLFLNFWEFQWLLLKWLLQGLILVWLLNNLSSNWQFTWKQC